MEAFGFSPFSDDDYDEAVKIFFYHSKIAND